MFEILVKLPIICRSFKKGSIAKSIYFCPSYEFLAITVAADYLYQSNEQLMNINKDFKLFYY